METMCQLEETFWILKQGIEHAMSGLLFSNGCFSIPDPFRPSVSDTSTTFGVPPKTNWDWKQRIGLPFLTVG